ncbi:MAG: hypothetical protein LQ340_002383 [Diploschistes diacapsis]|nr:MAG: hypothetical protein LQ340_002383 [Diploschistes diacapsis]
MSRHNRRRTRGGHKSSISTHNASIDFSVPNQPASISGPSPFHQPSLPKAKSLPSAYRNGASARHWQNRYMAWQARERRQKEEEASGEAEKRRLFGDIEEDNKTCEDEELCQRMLEYFVGLDFIDP